MVVIDGVEMVDVREAAELSRRTPETIRRWVWSGRLTAVKNGNKLFVRRSDLEPTWTPSHVAAPSLLEWTKSLPSGRKGSGTTARDLVLQDRDERAGR